MVVTENPLDPPASADHELVAQLRAGDQDAFRRIVTDLTTGLTRLAQMYVPHALAEEVVQETWTAVVRSIGSFQERSSLTTWIYRILLNKVRTLATRESKIIPFAALGPRRDADTSDEMVDRLIDADLGSGHWTRPPDRWDTVPGRLLESAETLEVIEAAVAGLPPAQREVVELRDVQGFTAEEVCNTLGISSVNERVLLHRGRVALRTQLKELLTT